MTSAPETTARHAAAVDALDSVAEPPSRVLVVDDDEANRDSLGRRLQRRGYEVVLAVDGAQALDAVAAATNAFDLVILDWMMPGLSGLDVLTRLRQRYTAAELPIIMATAKDGSEDVVEAFKLGASDYVTKPLDFAVVLARVQTQMSLRQSVRRVLALERYLSDRNAELEAANERLRKAAERTNRELVLAAKIQAAYLPKEAGPRVHHVRFAWRYEPSAELAGDALNVCELDAEHVGFYLLDVSGHGVAASLTAVSAARMLAAPTESDSILVDRLRGSRLRGPADVMAHLNERFAFNADTGQFLTCFYGVLNTATRVLTYASAGHPGPMWVPVDGRPPRMLESTGLPVGIGERYEERVIALAAGDRVYAYSDGVSESRGIADEDLFGTARLATLVDGLRPFELLDSVTRLELAVADFRGGRPAGDDLSVLALECG